jgi:3-hydroxyisobutyrate dehydrogenase-like beta-hydroxyacid dehydrogenase
MSTQKPKLGILHPGSMGVSVAATAQNSGCEVYWASEGRSANTRARAEAHGLRDAGALSDLCRACSVIVSVCPPDAAEEVAEEVRSRRFSGLFLDANAISPQRAVRIGERLAAAGISFVDGGIIGGPAWEPGSTRLYLSGGDAGTAADCFAAGPLATIVMGTEIGQASALKMCYAAWTKGSTALLCAVLAAAAELGVSEELAHRWEQDWPGFGAQAANRARQATAKAWRFAGEMDEIAATFAAAGLPGGFYVAAAELYRRLAGFRDASATPSLEEVLAALVAPAAAPDD